MLRVYKLFTGHWIDLAHVLSIRDVDMYGDGGWGVSIEFMFRDKPIIFYCEDVRKYNEGSPTYTSFKKENGGWDHLAYERAKREFKLNIAYPKFKKDVEQVIEDWKKYDHHVNRF